MCSAEVLVFAAEVLRRPVGARPTGVAGVCRRLFAGGDADTGRIARGMEEELRRRVSARWNFDFEKEKPLPGRYQWVPVGVPQQKLKPTPVQEVRQSRKLVSSSSTKKAAPSLAKQHKITDFLTKKKRPLSSEVPTPHKLRRLNFEAPTPASPT